MVCIRHVAEAFTFGNTRIWLVQRIARLITWNDVQQKHSIHVYQICEKTGDLNKEFFTSFRSYTTVCDQKTTESFMLAIRRT